MSTKILGTFKKNKLWPHVRAVCMTLQVHGHTAWIAGGAVRDALMGRVPKDFDVATSATPEEVQGLFSKTISVGKAFGVIKVVIKGGDVEVASFRKDGLYIDGRRPTQVEFSTPEQDASRRDFTINGLFYDPRGKKIWDFVGGTKDLRLKKIRTIGMAEERFSEDKLRILRALRFVSQLGFSLDRSTQKAIVKSLPQILSVSQERYFNEMNKLLEGGYLVKALKVMEKCEFRRILPPSSGKLNFKPAPDLNSRWLQWVLLIEGTKDRMEYIRELKCPTDLKSRLINAIQCLDLLANFESYSQSKKWKLVSRPEFPMAFEIYKLGFKKPPAKLKKIKKFANDHKALPSALIVSSDLFLWNVRPGEKFGLLLDQAFEAQLNGEFKSKPEALKWLKNKVSSDSNLR